MTRRVAIFVPDEVQLSSVAAPTDLLQLANRFARERTGQGAGAATRDTAAPISCRWLSLTGAPARLCSGGQLPVDAGIGHDEIYDAICIGAFESADEEALQQRLQATQGLSAWLQRQHGAGALIAASGSGVFLLAESGLLDRRTATAPWWLKELFHRRYPAVRLDTQQRLTDSDGLMCAGSLAGLLPLALRLAQKLTSANTADWLAKTTLIDAAAHPESPLAGPGITAGDALVAAAQYQLQQHYAEKAQIAELARKLAVSPRTLVRRFHAALGMSPQAYVQTLRIESAKLMLLRTSLRVDRIGQQVGYGDAGFFKRLFREQTGMSPQAWRASAGSHDTAGAAHARPA